MLELIKKSSSSSKVLTQELQKAWLLRWNQRIDEAMMALAKIQVQEGWENLSPDGLTMKTTQEEWENHLDALLLKGSFLRAQGQEQKSSALLRRILNKNTELSGVKGFRLTFELGLDAWRREDIAGAMDHFLMAEKKARDIYERLFSLMNMLLCLESLDLNRCSVETKIETLILEVKEKFSSEEIKNVQEQWAAYLMRKEFYQKMNLPIQKEISGQASFFQDWITELPYMSVKSDLSFTANENYLWQSSYRMRTLRGIWSPSDRSVVRASDAIDRLYLWVWKWMAQDDMSMEKVLWTLESILQQLEYESQSKENLLLLRNACFWMTNVAPELEGKLKKILARLQKVTSEHYPVLETEFLLIQGLFQKDGEDLVKLLGRFGAFDELYKDHSSLPLLHKRLTYLKELQKGENGKAYYASVDLVENKIFLPLQNRSVRSAPLARLMFLLQKNPRVPFSSFESEAEPRRIYNFVERLKAILPKKALWIENGEVVRGKEWPRLWILHEDSGARQDLTSEIPSPKLKYVGSESHYFAARALIREDFDRKKLEATLAVSKATACRMIEEWLDLDWVVKKGLGKRTSYTWNEKVEKK